jgi:alkanesulfonate monooxygenase SsuD/methylene tetrahydromethanopterin reductase-like flavin-dependent oxidoreductase (luciferase family)
MKLSLSLDIAPGEPIAAFKERAERLDQARPDFVILAGQEEAGTLAPPLLEALVDSAWITGVLKSACVVAGLPALHAIPFHVSRALSAVDFLSAGRSGWMPLTSDTERFDIAYGTQLSGIDAAEVTARYDDFIKATQALWDSWDDDALVLDKASGVYLDSTKVRRVDYRGPFFGTMGPLNAARPLQGYPLLLRDTDAITGSSLAADVAIGSHETLGEANAPIKLLKVDTASDTALDGGLAAVAAGEFDGLHLYGSRTLEVLGTLDRSQAATEATTRVALGLAHPTNPFAAGAVT